MTVNGQTSAGGAAAGAETKRETVTMLNPDTGLPHEVDVNPVQDKQPEQKPTTKTTDDGNAEGEGDKKEKAGGFTRKLAAKDARIQELERQLAERNTQTATEKKDAGANSELKEPKQEDFETFGEFYAAQAEYRAKKVLQDDKAAAKQQSEKDRLETEQRERVTNHQTRARKFMEANPDYDEVIDAGIGDMAIPPYHMQQIMDSEHGPEITYHLAKNPEEAQKAFNMGALAFTKYVGRLEARFEAESPAEEKTVTPAAKTTKAPPPITPVGKSTSTSTKDPGEMSYREFKAWEASRKKA